MLHIQRPQSSIRHNGVSPSPAERPPVRTRSLPLISALAAVALLTAGCSGAAAPTSTPTPEPTETGQPAPRAECALDVQPGEISDSLASIGAWGDDDVTVPADTVIGDLQRTVLSRGSGEEVLAGALVALRFQIHEVGTEEIVDSSERGENGLLPTLLDARDTTLFLVALECLPLGSEVVFAVPGVNFGEGAPDIVVYAQAVEFLPTRAQGTPVAPAEGMPTVVLDENGAPTITIPDADAPTATRVELLQAGDGAVVQPGDMVVVQYRGVKWTGGEEFDASWTRNAVPSQFRTNQVVNGFRLALEGQKVGSQVLVVMPPADGYGGSAGHALEHETLVFVVDILATSSMDQG